MPEACIDLKNINLFFGKKQILRQINLSVAAGKICGLLGPSGCGKTTMVKVAAGILKPTSGQARVLDQNPSSFALMARVGYMAQSDALYPTLTAEENIQFFAALYGLHARELRRRTEEVMALVNLSEHLKKPVQLYSGGMKRRLSLALALLHRPSVLILDEPTVGIDPLLRQDVWRNLRDLAQSGVTILVTTHVMDEAEKCEQLAMMRDGVLLAHGSLAELLANSGAANIEEAFISYSSAI
ncbi:MAG: ABC transporter ATP-binding protein [Clostridiales Family XIII bacterium]|jgi:ABC-2 type transport system ATP-binding protein|nr:ABC transporter ATP-binding protein [Clostridiales Family XIII bacterium]